jgi:hypothetical protein
MPGRRRFLSRASLLALGAGIGAVPGASRSASRDVLRMRGYADVSTLDPPMMLSGAEAQVISAIHLNLIQFRAGDTWDWELDAAEAFEQLDDRHYAFRLRPGIQYSNGFGEMTATDVKYSFERVIDPALKAPNVLDMGTLSHVEVSGRYSGIIVLRSPFASDPGHSTWRPSTRPIVPVCKVDRQRNLGCFVRGSFERLRHCARRQRFRRQCDRGLFDPRAAQYGWCGLHGGCLSVALAVDLAALGVAGGANSASARSTRCAASALPIRVSASISTRTSSPAACASAWRSRSR